MAVLPPRVTLERKIWMSDEKFTELTMKKQTKLHDQLVRSFHRRINEGRCFVEVLDPNATAYLAFSDDYNQGRITSKELCKLLNVDAVFATSIQILEPVSEFTALFFLVLQFEFCFFKLLCKITFAITFHSGAVLVFAFQPYNFPLIQLKIDKPKGGENQFSCQEKNHENRHQSLHVAKVLITKGNSCLCAFFFYF